MSIIAGKPKQGFDRELPTEDQHVAVLTGVWDLGTRSKTWQGETKDVHEVMMCFEVDQKLSKGEFIGKNMCVYFRVKLSLHEKAKLRKAVEAIRSKALEESELETFDIESLIGMPCLADIKYTKSPDGVVYANINQISKLPKQLTAFEPDHIYSNGETPDWIKKIQDTAIDTDSDGNIDVD